MFGDVCPAFLKRNDMSCFIGPLALPIACYAACGRQRHGINGYIMASWSAFCVVCCCLRFDDKLMGIVMIVSVRQSGARGLYKPWSVPAGGGSFSSPSHSALSPAHLLAGL